MPDNIERVVKSDLDQLPLLPPERWIPNSKRRARSAPSWLRPLAFVPATLVIVLVALAAGTQLADWRAQRESSAGQAAIATIPGPLALAGAVPSSGFGLLSSGMNNLLVRSETSEDTLFPIAGGWHASVSPDGRSIAAWTAVPGAKQQSLRVYDTIDRTVGPILLTSTVDSPTQTLWSADGTGIIAGTQTPITRDPKSTAPPPPTRWFAVDVRAQKATELPAAFGSAVSVVHAWDRQRDLITGSGFSGATPTFTALAGGHVSTHTVTGERRIAAADSYGRSLMLFSYGACGTGDARITPGQKCPVFEILDQASFTPVFSFSRFTTPVGDTQVVFRPRSQDLIVQLLLPNGDARVELWPDLGRGQSRVLGAYTPSGKFTGLRDLLLPRVDGSAVFILKFDQAPFPRWFGELVSLSVDSKTSFEISAGGNPLASVVLDPAFARALEIARASTSPQPSPALPAPRPWNARTPADVLANLPSDPNFASALAGLSSGVPDPRAVGRTPSLGVPIYVRGLRPGDANEYLVPVNVGDTTIALMKIGLDAGGLGRLDAVRGWSATASFPATSEAAAIVRGSSANDAVIRAELVWTVIRGSADELQPFWRLTRASGAVLLLLEDGSLISAADVGL